jgi:hypothetical protein
MIKSETVMSRAVRWLCYGKMNRLYPAGIPDPVRERFEQEWTLLQQCGKAEDFYVFHALAEEAARSGIPFNLRGPGNASLLAYLLNDSAIDPMPAYRYCRHCGHYEEIPDAMYGLDAEETDCPRCRRKMRASGFSLPLEAAWPEGKGINLSEYSTKLSQSAIFSVLKNLYGGRVALMAEEVLDEHDKPKLMMTWSRHFVIFPEGKTLADYPDIMVKCEQKKAVFAPLEELDRLGIRTMMFAGWRGYAIGDNPAQTLRGICPMPQLIERLRDKVSPRSLIAPSESLFWTGYLKTRWAIQGMQSAPPSSYYELTETICRRHSSWISPYESAARPVFSSSETLFNLLRREGMEKDDAAAVTRFIRKGRASEPKYRAEWLEILKRYPVLEKYRKDAENCAYLWTQAAVLPAVMDAIACAGRKTI